VSTVAGRSGVDPLMAPLTYPGQPPRRKAVLVAGSDVFGLQPVRGAALGQWRVRLAGRAAPDGPVGPGDPSGAADPVGADEPLDHFLRGQGVAPFVRRTPVLSVGSNASPAQIRRKMANAGLRAVVPITGVKVHGMTVGVSAHVSRPGYVPATPVSDSAALSDMWVLWLDPQALSALDATEPNYHRIRLSSCYAVHLRPGQPVPGCSVYVSRHGHLVNQAGEPRILTDQATLITGLLAQVPALVRLAGTTPAEWIRRTRDDRVRDGIRTLFLAAGIVRPGGIEAGTEAGTEAGREPGPR
jgi:hypothetical protein